MLRTHAATDCSRGLPGRSMSHNDYPPRVAAGAHRPRQRSANHAAGAHRPRPIALPLRVNAPWPAKAAPSAATAAGLSHGGAAAKAACSRAKNASPAARGSWWPGSRDLLANPVGRASYGTRAGCRRPIPAFNYSFLKRFSTCTRQDDCGRPQHIGGEDAGSAATPSAASRSKLSSIMPSSSQSCLLARLSHVTRAKPLPLLLVLLCFCCTSITGTAASSSPPVGTPPVNPKFMWDVKVLTYLSLSLTPLFTCRATRPKTALLSERCNGHVHVPTAA